MKIRIALAALLAATAFTPATAQMQAEGPGEPTPIPERVERRMERAQSPRAIELPASQAAQSVEMAQNDGGRRGGWQGRQENPSRGNDGGGWQRNRVESPQVQAPAAVPQPAPQVQQRQWQRPEGQAGGWQGRQRSEGQAGNWQGRQRGEWNGQARQDWQQRRAPQAAIPQAASPVAPPVVQQEQRRWDGNRTGQTWNGARRDGEQVQQGGNWQNRQRWDGQNRDRTWTDNRDRTDDRRWDGNRSWNNGQRWDGNRNRNWQDNRQRYDNRAWNRTWRNDNRYDWQRYRYSNRDLFRANRYYTPYGWNHGYRRFSIGVTLWGGLYDQNYWIDDPYSYRLPEVYGPYRWVRYYDDVLLVDIYTGRVVDVIHDFFW